MKTLILFLGLIISGWHSIPALAQSVDFDIHIGNGPQAPPARFGPPPIVFEAPPRMVYSDGLRVYMAVGIPQDLFFSQNAYFYHHEGAWYRSPYYKGPWIHTDERGIPPELHRHRIEEIREYKRHAWEEHHERKMRFRERHFQAEEHDNEHHERHGREER
jgi:hypothetical protein